MQKATNLHSMIPRKQMQSRKMMRRQRMLSRRMLTMMEIRRRGRRRRKRKKKRWRMSLQPQEVKLARDVLVRITKKNIL